MTARIAMAVARRSIHGGISRSCPRAFALCSIATFNFFFAGQTVSLIGTWMQSTAQLWLVYKLTKSAALLGVFGFANQIPIFAAGVDRRICR